MVLCYGGKQRHVGSHRTFGNPSISLVYVSPHLGDAECRDSQLTQRTGVVNHAEFPIILLAVAGLSCPAAAFVFSGAAWQVGVFRGAKDISSTSTESDPFCLSHQNTQSSSCAIETYAGQSKSNLPFLRERVITEMKWDCIYCVVVRWCSASAKQHSQRCLK